MGMAVRFITRLIACPVGRKDGRRIWELQYPFVVEIDGVQVVVPEGFQTDYASVPRLPITYALFGDTAHEAGSLHDYLYRAGAVPNVPKKTADRWFMDVMDYLNEPPGRIRRWIMYKAVCWFANSCWKKKDVMARLA